MPRRPPWSLLVGAALALAAPSARADERDRVIREMATCDAIAKIPPLLMLGAFGVRGVVGAASGAGRPFIHAGTEERLFLAALGTAAAGHSLCGPAVFAGHQAYARASLSLGLRFGLPVAALGLTLGLYRAREPRGDFGSGASDVVGTAAAGLAVLAGFAVDYAWAARLAPVVAPSPAGAVFGLGGAF
jgi:hypothetical protein